MLHSSYGIYGWFSTQILIMHGFDGIYTRPSPLIQLVRKKMILLYFMLSLATDYFFVAIGIFSFDFNMDWNFYFRIAYF